MHQITLTLQPKILIGKKTERLSIPCSSEFLGLVDQIAAMRGTTRAEFAFEAVLDLMKSSLGEIFMAELHGEKTVAEIAADGKQDQVSPKYPPLNKEVIP